MAVATGEGQGKPWWSGLHVGAMLPVMNPIPLTRPVLIVLDEGSLKWLEQAFSSQVAYKPEVMAFGAATAILTP